MASDAEMNSTYFLQFLWWDDPYHLFDSACGFFKYWFSLDGYAFKISKERFKNKKPQGHEAGHNGALGRSNSCQDSFARPAYSEGLQQAHSLSSLFQAQQVIHTLGCGQMKSMHSFMKLVEIN